MDDAFRAAAIALRRRISARTARRSLLVSLARSTISAISLSSLMPLAMQIDAISTGAIFDDGGGSIGVMVKLDTDIAPDNAEMLTAGKDCALQVAAMNPRYLDEASVPESAIEEEKNIMLVQMNEDPKMASKPEQVKAKIIDGKIGKFYKENCLLDQTFVKDDKVSVKQYLDSVAKAQGGKLTVSEFVRYERGEGIEKKQDNFADEVASMIK